ncbi:MAG: hypothetical protein WC169_00970 [Dehalococcoidia bacterium]|jgi:hypothetical protein
MIADYEEKIASDFIGTIIDIETIGNFSDYFNDSRRYKDIIQVILGYIDGDHIRIYCAKSHDGIEALKSITNTIIDSLRRPLYAFNSEFEQCVLFHHIGREFDIECELNSEKYEKKKNVVRYLNIPNYNDPFYDDGYKCIGAWERKQFDDAIAHNRACLLKERDILIKRGFRTPDRIALVK